MHVAVNVMLGAMLTVTTASAEGTLQKNVLFAEREEYERVVLG